MTDEEPVFLADRRGPDGVFDEVIVDPRLPVLQVRNQRLPVTDEIIASFAEQRLWEGRARARNARAMRSSQAKVRAKCRCRSAARCAGSRTPASSHCRSKRYSFAIRRATTRVALGDSACAS
jgi:hypothetical protein